MPSVVLCISIWNLQEVKLPYDFWDITCNEGEPLAYNFSEYENRSPQNEQELQSVQVDEMEGVEGI